MPVFIPPDYSSIVANAFSRAQAYVNTSQSQASGFLSSLTNLVGSYTVPTIGANVWDPSAPPPPTTVPNAPTLPGDALPVISFQYPSGEPGDLVGVDPVPPAIPTFDGTLQDFPPISVPPISVSPVPAVPAMGVVDTPDAPSVAIPAPPTLLALNTPTFSGVDIHAEMLPDFQSIPILTLYEPTPFTYTPPSGYTDAFLDALKAELTDRITNGGTGLPAAIEQAIWDRARSREEQAAANDEDEVTRLGEASGFPMPAGATTYNLLQARQKYNDKVSALSRDIAIKQAELEQKNIEHAITEGIKLEAAVIDQATKLLQIGFEAAKVAAQLGIEKYNADVKAYDALLNAYKTYAASYEAIIKGELARVEAYKAEWQGVTATADANKALASMYDSQVKAALGQVEIYKAEVEAAKALVEMEKAKIQAAETQIKGYIANVNAQTAVLEGSKIQAQVQTAVTDAYKSEVQAYAAQVDALAKTAQIDAEYAKINVDVYKTRWEGWRAKVEAEKARVAALTAQSSSIVDGYKATASIAVAQAEISTKQWEAEIKNYEAIQNYTLNVSKINADILARNRDAMLDAAKVGAQVYAQLSASAYGTVHANASVSNSGMSGTSYSASDAWNNNFNNQRAVVTNHNYNY